MLGAVHVYVPSRRAFRTLLRSLLRGFFGKQGQRFLRGLRLFYRLRIEAILTTDEIARLARRTEVRLWVDGTEAFARIERLLRGARHTIVIQMFIWKDDPTGRSIAEVLLDAADRGVKVDITKELVGDFFEGARDFLTTKQSTSGLWNRFWSHPLIHVHYAKHIDHAKVYVIDDQILLLSGMNIADENRLLWHDYLVELRGSQFVEQYFTQWALPLGNAPVQLCMNTDEQKNLRHAFLWLLQGAQESIVVEHCYLSDPAVLEALIRRSQEGVRVTVILPRRTAFHHFANMQSVGKLLSEGAASMRVLLYPGMVHAKIVLVDRSIAFLGSANLMPSSLDRMGEVNVFIAGRYRRALVKLRDTLRSDILRSRPITHPPHALWWSRMMAMLGL